MLQRYVKCRTLLINEEHSNEHPSARGPEADREEPERDKAHLAR